MLDHIMSFILCWGRQFEMLFVTVMRLLEYHSDSFSLSLTQSRGSNHIVYFKANQFKDFLGVLLQLINTGSSGV